jgi:hypothetical protein
MATNKYEEKWTEKKKRRSKKSLFQLGLRAMSCIFVGTCFIHELWELLTCVGWRDTKVFFLAIFCKSSYNRTGGREQVFMKK